MDREHQCAEAFVDTQLFQIDIERSIALDLPEWGGRICYLHSRVRKPLIISGVSKDREVSAEHYYSEQS